MDAANKSEMGPPAILPVGLLPLAAPAAALQEAAMMASLRHPSIVMYLGVCLVSCPSLDSIW